MYRKDILDQAGLTMPIAPTWSEYVELCKKVYDTTGHTSKIAVSLGDLQLAVRNYGLNIYNDEGTALGFDNPAYIVDMWQRYLDAVAYGFQLGVGETTASTPFDEFVADSWTGFHSTNELAAYEKGSGCELEMAAYPSLDDATQAPSYFKPTMFWSVSNDSKVKDAAVTFINFFTNDTACYDIVGIDRGIPVSSVIRDYLAPTLDATSQKVVAMMDYLGQEGHTSPLMKPNLPVHNEIDALFTSYFEEVQYGTVSDLTAQAQAFMDEANAIIAKSLKSN
jgi:multiple sugar transport system substrate-binding protein